MLWWGEGDEWREGVDTEQAYGTGVRSGWPYIGLIEHRIPERTFHTCLDELVRRVQTTEADAALRRIPVMALGF